MDANIVECALQCFILPAMLRCYITCHYCGRFITWQNEEERKAKEAKERLEEERRRQQEKEEKEQRKRWVVSAHIPTQGNFKQTNVTLVHWLKKL